MIYKENLFTGHLFAVDFFAIKTQLLAYCDDLRNPNKLEKLLVSV